MANHIQHYFNAFLRILAKLYNSVIVAMTQTSWREAFNRLWEGYHPQWSPQQALDGLLVVLAVLVVFLILHLLGKICFRQGLSAVVLTIYLTFVLGSTVFTRDPGQFMTPNFHLLISYRVMMASQSYLAAKGIVLNMLLLMPIGLLLPVILQKRFFLWPVLAGFGCSLMIELMQYYFRCGMFDVDDLLNNTLGVWLGYLIYWAVTLIPYFKQSRLDYSRSAKRKIG